MIHLLAEYGISYSQNAFALAQASEDFGRLRKGNAQLVVCPRNNKEVATVIELANQEGWSIAPRGQGCSQSGQSVTPDGICMDSSRLDTIQFDERSEVVTCGAGASWRQLVGELSPKGYLPCAMPLNLNLSVGGTLSAGGFGSTGHQYGAVVDTVLELEVLTGTGELIRCSRSQDVELFQACLAGQGRCAFITSAKIRLRSFSPQVRVYYLLYDDLEQWVSDQQYLSSCAEIYYMEGFCSAAAQGIHQTAQGYSPLIQWLYGLQVGIEFTAAPRGENLLQELHYWKQVHVEDNLTTSFLARYDTRFRLMQKSGSWQQAHPWFDCLLPWQQAGEIIPKILQILPPCFGDGHRVLKIAECESAKFLMKPDEPYFLFAALPAGIPDVFLDSVRMAVLELDQLVHQYGGRRCLSGWLENQDEAFWKLHFGEAYLDWQRLKRVYDPNGVFSTLLFPS